MLTYIFFIYSKIGVEFKISEFKYFPHGFLNYDVPILFKEAGYINDLVISHMNSLLSSGKKNNKDESISLKLQKN